MQYVCILYESYVKLKSKICTTYIHMYSLLHSYYNNLGVYGLFSTYKQTDITNFNVRNVLFSMQMYLVDLLIPIMILNGN